MTPTIPRKLASDPRLSCRGTNSESGDGTYRRRAFFSGNQNPGSFIQLPPGPLQTCGKSVLAKEALSWLLASMGQRQRAVPSPSLSVSSPPPQKQLHSPEPPWPMATRSARWGLPFQPTPSSVPTNDPDASRPGSITSTRHTGRGPQPRLHSPINAHHGLGPRGPSKPSACIHHFKLTSVYLLEKSLRLPYLSRKVQYDGSSVPTDAQPGVTEDRLYSCYKCHFI